MKIIYFSEEYEKTGEIHIYKGEMFIDDSCKFEKKSLCNSVENQISDPSHCKSEQEMREFCANKLKRAACANCVGELYKTLEHDNGDKNR